MFLWKPGGRSCNDLHTYIHDHHCLKLIGQQLYCASGHRPITHVEQIKWPMADFHLGQHLLFRKHAYTVTCHLAPGALWRPTLPLRDGPPFCSVLKMISVHEISWGAHKLFPLLCIPVWIFPPLVSVKVCERVQTVRAWCQAAFARLHILVRAHFLVGVSLNTIWMKTSDAHSVYETVVHCCCVLGERLSHLKAAVVFTARHILQ